MCVYVVTEGPSDADLVEFLLEPEIHERQSADDREGIERVRVVPGGGQSGAISLGRSLLALKRQPVALLVDADTNDEERIEEFRDFLIRELRITAGDTPFRVLIAVPVIESILFQSPSTTEWIREQLGEPVSAEYLLEAKYDPKKLTAKLLEKAFPGVAKEGAPSGVWRRLLNSHPDPVAVRGEIRGTPLIRDLLEFIEEQTPVKV